MRDLIFPIGRAVILYEDVSPASLYGGTWEKESEGYALWSASSGAGEKIAAGIPNIVGNFYVGGNPLSSGNQDYTRIGGAIRYTTVSDVSGEKGGGGGDDNRVYFNAAYGDVGASKANPSIPFANDTRKKDPSASVYGNSDTVQPPAVKIYLWHRIG